MQTYLPHRSNLEKYLPTGVLELHSQGLELIEQPQALITSVEQVPIITRPSLPPTTPLRGGRVGIWIHEEDLLIEQSPLAALKPSAILTTGDTATWNRLRYPEPKTAWLRNALTDAAERTVSAFGVEAWIDVDSPITESLLRWTTEHRLQQIAAIRPEIGPLHDQFHDLQIALTTTGIVLVLFDRPEDVVLRPLASGGFFGFWEKMRKLPKAGV